MCAKVNNFRPFKDICCIRKDDNEHYWSAVVHSYKYNMVIIHNRKDIGSIKVAPIRYNGPK